MLACVFFHSFLCLRVARCVRWAASFQSKHCWQLSAVIKSHVTKPSVHQLWSSVKLKVVWVCVWVLGEWQWKNRLLCAFVCLRHSYTGVTTMPFIVKSLWRVSDKAPQEDCLMCWYRQECFLKVFCRSRRKKKDGNKHKEDFTSEFGGLILYFTYYPLNVISSAAHKKKGIYK